jgi:uncharacterized membrane protein YfcA
MVPLLTGVLKLPQHLAHGTSLAVIIFVASASLIGYATVGNVDWPLVGLFAGSAAVGGFVGARTMQRVSALRLRQIFGLFLLAVAIRMFIT